MEKDKKENEKSSVNILLLKIQRVMKRRSGSKRHRENKKQNQNDEVLIERDLITYVYTCSLCKVMNNKTCTFRDTRSVKLHFRSNHPYHIPVFRDTDFKRQRRYSLLNERTKRRKLNNCYGTIENNVKSEEDLNNFCGELGEKIMKKNKIILKNNNNNKFNYTAQYENFYGKTNKLLKNQVSRLKNSLSKKKSKLADKEIEIKQLKRQYEELKSENSILKQKSSENFDTNIRNYTNSVDKIEAVKSIVRDDDLFKLYNSVMLLRNNKDDQFKHFNVMGISYSSTFVYQPRSYNIVQVFKVVEDHFLNSMNITFSSFDNNDITIPHGSTCRYIPTTSYVLFEAFIPKGLKFSKNIVLLKSDAPTGIQDRDEQNRMLNVICMISLEEQKRIDDEIAIIFNILITGNPSALLYFDSPKKRFHLDFEKYLENKKNHNNNNLKEKHTTTFTDNNIKNQNDPFLNSLDFSNGYEDEFFEKLDYSKDSNINSIFKENQNISDDQKIILKFFLQYLNFTRCLQIQSSITPCKSGDDFDRHVAFCEKKTPNSLHIFGGDQPVFEKQREEKPAVPGKFHIRMNMLGSENILFHFNGFYFLQTDHFKLKKSLLITPKGYFKINEQIFFNTYFLYYKMMIQIYFDYLKVYNSENYDSYKTNSNCFNFVMKTVFTKQGLKLKKFGNETSYYQNLDTIVYMMKLSNPYYFLVKSIKTSDFLLYKLSLKLFIPLCLECGNTNYHRLFLKHLYDLEYRWTPEMLKIFICNLSYLSESNNTIAFDEFIELLNKVIKPGYGGKEKRLLTLSELNNIIRFCQYRMKKKRKRETIYAKQKIDISLFEQKTNPIYNLLNSRNWKLKFPTKQVKKKKKKNSIQNPNDNENEKVEMTTKILFKNKKFSDDEIKEKSRTVLMNSGIFNKGRRKKKS